MQPSFFAIVAPSRYMSSILRESRFFPWGKEEKLPIFTATFWERGLGKKNNTQKKKLCEGDLCWMGRRGIEEGEREMSCPD